MNEDLLTYIQGFLTPERVGKFKEVSSTRTRHITVVTEGLSHLHNTSAVIRSCEAFGVQDVHVIEEIRGRRIDKEIAMGAQKWTTIHRHAWAKDAINDLKGRGYRIVATTPHHTAHTLANFDIKDPAAIFFGKESIGLSETVLDEADAYIYIPTFGFTQSLNISVSAAIIIQELMDRLRNSTIAWKLTEEEQLELQLTWAKANIKNIQGILQRYGQ
ncbi:MAG: rRNA methyltransferase [Cytophagaceae bacterium]|nr:rRNA methyltransferase [Cytophagaceae bacterium]